MPFIAGRESSGEKDPYAARNPQSSAAGKFQFTDDTGKLVLTRHPEIVQGIDYDPTKQGFVSSLPAEVQDAMGLAHAKDQAALLAKSGFEPTPQNIYINHFLGEAGGPNFLRRMMQDPTAPAYSLVSSGAVNSNQKIFFDERGNPRTAAQFYDIMGSKAPTGGGGGLGAGRPPADIGRTGDVAPEQLGFFDRNKNIILPVLQGLGAMAGSKSRFLGSAILEGLGAGAKAYGDVQQQQALTDAARAQGMSTLSGIGPVIGQFGPTGQPEYRVKVADYGKGSLAPTKTPLQQEQERQRKAAEAAVSGKPTTETPISVAQTDRGYNYDVAPTSMSSDALIKAVGSDDKNVTPQLIAANPGLQGQEKLDAELANNRSANAQQASQVRNDLNTMHEAFTGIGPEGFGSKGAGFDERMSLINMWNWAARQAPGIFGEVQPKDLTNAQILDKLRTINVTDFTNKSGSSHAGFIQQAMSNSLPSGAMDENAGIHVMANMYMQNQDGDDFRRFYSNYRNAHGTALNAPTAFEKEMGQRYQMERQNVIHALTPQERPDGTRMSPVDIIRQDPTKAAAFDSPKRYGMPGLARVFLGG